MKPTWYEARQASKGLRSPWILVLISQDEPLDKTRPYHKGEGDTKLSQDLETD